MTDGTIYYSDEMIDHERTEELNKKICGNCEYYKGYEDVDEGRCSNCSSDYNRVFLNDTCMLHKETQHHDNVNSPSHYNQGKYEVIDVIEDWDLDFHLANAIKYIARAEHKGNFEEDIKKAIWYLNRKLGVDISDR